MAAILSGDGVRQLMVYCCRTARSFYDHIGLGRLPGFGTFYCSVVQPRKDTRVKSSFGHGRHALARVSTAGNCKNMARTSHVDFWPGLYMQMFAFFLIFVNNIDSKPLIATENITTNKCRCSKRSTRRKVVWKRSKEGEKFCKL